MFEFRKQKHVPPRVRRAHCPPLLGWIALSANRLIFPRLEAQAFLTVNSQSWTPGRECRKREADCVDLGLLKASTEQNRGALVLRVPGPGCEPGHCWEILPYSAFWEAGCTQWASEDVFPCCAQKSAEAFAGCRLSRNAAIVWHLGVTKGRVLGKVVWFNWS